VTRQRWLAVVLAALALVVSPWASAQDPFGPGIAPMGGGQQGAQAKPKAPPPGTPEMHAAGGGDSLLPPGSEPSLPKNPLKIGKKLKLRLGTSTQLDELPQGQTGEPKREFYGLYYSEQNGGYRFRVAFPVWAERTQPSLTKPKILDRASLYGGLYYNRRSAERADDVLFPLFWNMRDLTDGSRTTVVGPWVNRVAPGERDNWLAPLYFTGKRKHGGYTFIPPLFTYTRTNADGQGGFNLVGPMFCSWKGGRHCDPYGLRPGFRRRALLLLRADGAEQVRVHPAAPPLLQVRRPHRDLREPLGSVLSGAHPGAGDLPPDAPVLEHLGARRAAHDAPAVLPLRVQGKLVAVREPLLHPGEGRRG
jgi:hypothetical protein